MGALPQRTIAYNGFITEAKRWADFQHRPDDIFICTPAKSGTTWTQAIMAMLVFGRADIDAQPGNISPWYDANFAPVEAINGMLAAQDHRRSLKTHTPLDGLPFFPECTYIAVYRDPRDVFFSFTNHLENMNHGLTGNAPPPELHQGFADWSKAPMIEGKAEHFALAAPLHHLKTFWAFRHLPNIHLFHYADMKRDLAGSVRAMAKAIGVAPSDATIAEIARAASFSNMREHADQFAPGAGTGVWKQEKEFFNAGRQGQWRDILSDQDLAAYRATLAATLPVDAAKWIESGGPLPA